MPPIRTGIAACSADIVPLLRRRHEIDVYVDQPASAADGIHDAHEFVWRNRLRPYDLTVYQMGNSAHHEYAWPYLFRFPGVTVLHDARLHHARASALLRHGRAGDYRAEFVANHPGAGADAAELAVAGFDSHLYYMWPMIKLVIERSRLTAVHSPVTAGALQESYPDGRVEYIRLSQGAALGEERVRAGRDRIRQRYRIPSDAILFGCFGGLAPEKRLPQVLDAFASLLPHLTGARLLLAGEPAPDLDLLTQVRCRGLEDRTILTGYLDSEDELTDCVAAADVAVTLRWPTAREISGPWLRALAAGKPSIVVDLVQSAHVPSLDPRTWTARSDRAEPVCVAIDILDEDHSLRLAMRRLGRDPQLRQALGAAAQRHWLEHHSRDGMATDYERVLTIAQAVPAPGPRLPAHLVDDGMARLAGLIEPFGMPLPLSNRGRL